MNPADQNSMGFWSSLSAALSRSRRWKAAKNNFSPQFLFILSCILAAIIQTNEELDFSGSNSLSRSSLGQLKWVTPLKAMRTLG